jgi:hypothetical protein
MNLVGSRLVLVVSTPAVQNVSDTTASARPGEPGRFMHRRHGWHGIVGAVVWLAIVVYVLWLATRLVRAVEKLADRSQERAS